MSTNWGHYQNIVTVTTRELSQYRDIKHRWFQHMFNALHSFIANNYCEYSDTVSLQKCGKNLPFLQLRTVKNSRIKVTVHNPSMVNQVQPCSRLSQNRRCTHRALECWNKTSCPTISIHFSYLTRLRRNTGWLALCKFTPARRADFYFL